MVAAPDNMKTNNSQLEMIAQPSYGKKLRYRCDYAKNDNRLGVLKNINEKSNYKGPAIRVNRCINICSQRFLFDYLDSSNVFT